MMFLPPSSGGHKINKNRTRPAVRPSNMGIGINGALLTVADLLPSRREAHHEVHLWGMTMRTLTKDPPSLPCWLPPCLPLSRPSLPPLLRSPSGPLCRSSRPLCLSISSPHPTKRRKPLPSSRQSC